MSWNPCTNSEPIARKQYNCQASDWVNNTLCLDDLTEDERKAYKTAEAEGWKILKGTRYLKASGFYDGEPSVFRARPDMDAICQKYQLYSD